MDRGHAEKPLRDAMVGATFHAIILDQFQRLRDGDPHFYMNRFSGAVLDEIHNTTLAHVIRRNSDIGDELPDNVFRVKP